MQNLNDYLNAHPDLRFIFTGGKGGVGKTVSAAVLAYRYAQEGKRTLLASLNPVHSLSSLFGQDLAGGTIKPVRGVDNLFAIEVSTEDAVERYRQNVGQRIREFLKYADIPVDPKTFIDIAMTNPAFEESAMFDKMSDMMLMQSGEYDRIVFDTAAVANAVRLIGLSKIYGLWLGRLIESRKEALSLRVQLSFRKEKVAQEVARDPMMADLMAMNERFIKVKELLVNPETTAFFFVTLPLSLPISVVKRFIEMVKGYDIPVGGVIVNQVITPQVLVGTADEYLTNKYKEQGAYLHIIDQDLGPLVRAYVPLYPHEVLGLDSLRQAAEDMFRPVEAVAGELLA